jgi:hypothetical protein
MPPETPLDERDCESSSIDAICSQILNTSRSYIPGLLLATAERTRALNGSCKRRSNNRAPVLARAIELHVTYVRLRQEQGQLAFDRGEFLVVEQRRNDAGDRDRELES